MANNSPRIGATLTLSADHYMAFSQDPAPPKLGENARRFAMIAEGGALQWAARGAAGLLVLFILSIAGALLWGGRQAFSTFGWSFLSDTAWDPVHQRFGALVPLYGTLLTTFLALLIAVPVSVGIAFSLTELVPKRLAAPLASTIELLAGIPSIVYGMWGLFVLAPIMAKNVAPPLQALGNRYHFLEPLVRGPAMGIGVLSAALVLSVMITPFISSMMREVFLTVPPELKESAFALGSTVTEVMVDVVVPYTKVAMLGSVVLGLGRALGETMAVTFVLGNSHKLSLSLLASGNSIAASVANEFTEADSPLYQSSLIGLGALLFVITFVVLTLARILLSRATIRGGVNQ